MPSLYVQIVTDKRTSVKRNSGRRGHVLQCKFPTQPSRSAQPSDIPLWVRLDKAQRGIAGDVKPVGDGVFEMREFFGPGWRMYYVKHGTVLIVMLGGGDKSRQDSDIAAAKKLATTLVFKE